MSHRAAKQIRQDARHDGFKKLRELFRRCAEDTRWFSEMSWEINDKMMRGGTDEGTRTKTESNAPGHPE